MASDARTQTVETDEMGKDPRSPESPEDVVRRLMRTETGNGPTLQPEPGHKTAPETTSDSASPAQSSKWRFVSAPKRLLASAWARVRTSVVSYRPMPRHMALILLAIIVLTMPWLIPVLALLVGVVIVISYLSIGHDRSVEMVMSGYGWQKNRNPQSAEAIRSGAARVSAGLSKGLGYLPDRWTSGLFLPDFIPSEEAPEKMKDDPFSRLAQQPQNQ